MITEPIPFAEAIRFLLNKEDLPAEWDASDWNDQEADFRNRAFWSAKVENARFLDRAHGFLFDFMAKTRETIIQPDGTVTTALQVNGREHFVKRMRDFMIAEGMAKPGEFVNVDQKDLTDIRSVARLRLIFDTNVRQAYGYGQWKQGMKPAVLRAFPAARLIRERGVKEPRPRHQNNLGEVRLKTDPRWAEFHNAREIGGFGVPWGPYGFQSGVTQEDVSRRKAIKLGLMVDIRNSDATPADVSSKRITDGLEASVKGMDPAIKEKLLEELSAKKAALGNPIERAGEAGRRAGENARREMLSRGLADAETRGEAGKAAKYRKAIAELPDASLKVRDDGDKIVLETAGASGMISPDERNSHIQKGEREMGPHKEPDERRIALNIRAASQDVFAGWTAPDGSGDEGELSQRAIEAQVSAAVTGRKPLYFEPWGEGLSEQFAESYRTVIPGDVDVVARDGMLFVFRPEAVQPIVDSDPEFYKIGNESLLDSIARVSAAGRNGELLGYGARDMLSRPAHGVTILRGKRPVLYYFISDPDPKHAAIYAQARADDFELSFGWDDVRFEIEKLD